MRQVQPSPEFDRIVALPVRDASAEDFGSAMVGPMTAKYSANPRNPDPAYGWLKPLQAQALYEFETYGGAFCAMRIGDGKTLTSLLAPEAMQAVRPLLILPAFLVQKTRAEIETYRRYWRLPANLRIKSYEDIGQPGAEAFLENFDPDLLIFDEAHRLKNIKSARTRRVIRFITARKPRVMALSGTFARIGIADYAHILAWTHGEWSPVPLKKDDVKAWDEAIGDKVLDDVRRDPGCLLRLAPVLTSDIPEGYAQLDPVAQRRQFARIAFQKRMRDTPGVIMSKGKGIPVGLTITFLRYELPERTRAMIDTVIETFETPDGWLVDSAALARQTARELALGYHSIWDPRPPPEWREARANWFRFVRQIVQYSKELDSEKPVKDAVDSGKISERTIAVNRIHNGKEIQVHVTGRQLLAEWRRLEPTFTPNPVDIWHDDVALRTCIAWGKHEPGIVWTENVFFALQLSRMTGWPYYGDGGCNAAGGFIEQEDGSRVIIASRPANGEGRNLQKAYGRNLITQLLPKSGVNEQLLGRTHRTGQMRDEVTADILCGTPYVEEAWDRAVQNALALRDMSGEEPKLLTAEVIR